jgi:hypothetical protein
MSTISAGIALQMASKKISIETLANQSEMTYA